VNPLVLNRKDAARALDVSVWVLDRYIADGLLPTVKLPSTKRPGEDNRRVLISVVDLEAFVAKYRESMG
jgi:predicted site-specific integrase-resolvase